jgi:hypothetical protein
MQSAKCKVQSKVHPSTYAQGVVSEVEPRSLPAPEAALKSVGP